MKTNNQFIPAFLLICITFIYSCQNEPSKPAQVKKTTFAAIKKHFDSRTPKKNKTSGGTETLEFIDYNDDGDYMLLNAKKGRILYGFINDNNTNRDLLRGDLVEITWKQDTIYIAGDGETPELADWVISAKKVKDGSLSIFRKTYQKPISYSWSEECDFNQEFQDKLCALAEYYLSKTDNEVFKEHIKNKDDMNCSIRKREKNGTAFLEFSISAGKTGQTGSIQTLYYSLEMDKLYEIRQNKLKEFD